MSPNETECSRLAVPSSGVAAAPGTVVVDPAVRGGVRGLGGHHAERQLLRRDQRGAVVDQRAHGRDAGGADDLGRGDQRAQPVRDVDDLLAGDAGEEVLVAAGDADDLVREHRADTSATSCSTTARLSSTGTSRLIRPSESSAIRGRRDRAEVGERLRLPPLVVEHGRCRDRSREPARRVAEVRGQRVLGHRARACPARPAPSAGTTRPCSAPWTARDQQRQRAGAGAVGHQHANTAPVEGRWPASCSAMKAETSSSSSTVEASPTRAADAARPAGRSRVSVMGSAFAPNLGVARQRPGSPRFPSAGLSALSSHGERLRAPGGAPVAHKIYRDALRHSRLVLRFTRRKPC